MTEITLESLTNRVEQLGGSITQTETSIAGARPNDCGECAGEYA